MSEKKFAKTIVPKSQCMKCGVKEVEVGKVEWRTDSDFFCCETCYTKLADSRKKVVADDQQKLLKKTQQANRDYEERKMLLDEKIKANKASEDWGWLWGVIIIGIIVFGGYQCSKWTSSSSETPPCIECVSTRGFEKIGSGFPISYRWECRSCRALR